jgi:hypothetical protein
MVRKAVTDVTSVTIVTGWNLAAEVAQAAGK